jgi:hypothetical protein
MIISTLHLIWTHCSLARPLPADTADSAPTPPATTPTSYSFPRPAISANASDRHLKKGTHGTLYLPDVPKEEFGYVWMTVPKNYRSVYPCASLRRDQDCVQLT